MPGEAKKTLKEKYKIFKTLYKEFSARDIMMRLSITEYQFNRFISAAIKDDRELSHDSVDYTTKTCFSYNEFDYGVPVPSTRVTKKGYLTFKNNPIKDFPTSELTRAVAIYKQSLNLI